MSFNPQKCVELERQQANDFCLKINFGVHWKKKIKKNQRHELKLLQDRANATKKKELFKWHKMHYGTVVLQTVSKISHHIYIDQHASTH